MESLQDVSNCFNTSGDFFKKTNNNKYSYKVDTDIQTLKCSKKTYKISKLLGSGVMEQK